MSGKSSPEFQWTDYEIQLPLLAATQNLNVEVKNITRRLQDFISQTNATQL